MNRRVAACLILTAFLLAPAAAAETAEFVARGNEPGWIVRKTVDGITFSPMDGPEVTVSPLPQMQEADGAAIYEATVNGESFKLTITQEVCVDTMSGMSYPASVSVETGGKRFEGCGGEPAALLHGAWIVEQIDGKPIVEGSNVTMDFGTEARSRQRLLQQVFQRLHADRRGADLLEGGLDDDGLRATAHGPGTAVPENSRSRRAVRDRAGRGLAPSDR
jgi:uncharacterized membrane protein